jgi:hypothetical protein
VTPRFRLLALAGLVLGLAAALRAAPATTPITGTYGLSGIADAGGELRLDPDGHYDWAVSLRRVNRSSTGRWTQNGDRITLTPDDPENPSGFTRAEISNWDELAERRYLRTTAESSWAGLVDRCPLLRIKTLIYPAPADRAPDAWRRYAHKAGREAVLARKRADAAMARWATTREGTPAWTAALAHASAAIASYQMANYYAEQAHAHAGIDPPDWQLLTYPDKCLPAKRPPADYEPLPAERHPQIGVMIGDREGASAFLGAKLEMIFSDGARIAAVSGPGGWTSLPVRPGQSLAAIRLSIDESDPAPIRVPAALSGAGVVVMDINPIAGDARRLEPTMLQIAADGSLRGAQGVYLR